MAVARSSPGDRLRHVFDNSMSRGEVAFATRVAGAVRRGETAIGFASGALARDGAGTGVRVNPAESERFAVGPGDRVVVPAEH